MRFRGASTVSPLRPRPDDATARLPHPRRLPPRRRFAGRDPRRGVGFKAFLALSLLSGMGIAWLVITAALARHDLSAARSEASILRAQITAADILGARRTADSLSHHARRSHRLTGGPAWWTAARVPVLGEPFRTIRGISAASDELARGALGPLIDVGHRMDLQTLRGPDGRVDLTALSTAEPALVRARTSLRRAATIALGLPRSTWLDSADHARAQIVATLHRLDQAVGRAQTAVRVLPEMLGANGPRTYFVAFQNDAEARGTGGLPGAFAILRAEQGLLTFERFENDNVMAGVRVQADLPPEYERLYGTSPQQLFVNSNLSPHFPYAASIWAAMWEKKTGQRVDGALALDPTALSGLLAVTGPARLPGGAQITAANVVAETQNASYIRYGADVDGRKQHLIAVARAVADRVIGFDGDPRGLVRALTQAAQQRRLLIWSAHPGVQAELAATPLSGSVPVTASPYVGMTVINSGGNKLDYYLDRSLTWQRSGCGPRRAVRVTIRLTNTVPASVTTKYITDRSDPRQYEVRPGDHRVALHYAATTGAVLTKAFIDGKATQFMAGGERGHPVFVLDVELPRGKTRTVVLELEEPGTDGPPVVLRQPLVRPLQTTIRDSECAS